MSEQLLEVMQDVRDRVIRIETQLEVMPQMQADIKTHDAEIIKAKASVKTIKWMAGLFVISVPTAVAAFVRIFKTGS